MSTCPTCAQNDAIRVRAWSSIAFDGVGIDTPSDARIFVNGHPGSLQVGPQSFMCADVGHDLLNTS
jgi:hypothetical protein